MEKVMPILIAPPDAGSAKEKERAKELGGTMFEAQAPAPAESIEHQVDIEVVDAESAMRSIIDSIESAMQTHKDFADLLYELRQTVQQHTVADFFFMMHFHGGLYASGGNEEEDLTVENPPEHQERWAILSMEE